MKSGYYWAKQKCSGSEWVIVFVTSKEWTGKNHVFHHGVSGAFKISEFEFGDYIKIPIKYFSEDGE